MTATTGAFGGEKNHLRFMKKKLEDSVPPPIEIDPEKSIIPERPAGDVDPFSDPSAPPAGGEVKPPSGELPDPFGAGASNS